MYCLIDNYDSFTYNLYQLFLTLGIESDVYYNDQIDESIIREKNYRALIISPGPGNPNAAGNCINIVKTLKFALPILGICLGHQILAQAYGAKIIAAPDICHGKTDLIVHNETDIFENIPQKCAVARYHSLCVDKNKFPAGFLIAAQNAQDTIMAIAHEDYPLYGLQFHPESLMTVEGIPMMKNFVQIVERFHAH